MRTFRGLSIFVRTGLADSFSDIRRATVIGVTALMIGLLLTLPGPARAGLDGDGILDAVFANFDQTNRFCLGDGLGGFACSDVSADARNSFGVALGEAAQHWGR